ncbi:phage tail tape measure protein [Streptomyces sp. SBT349]|uniref:phage tail tape measure protein n=1 Tax=Streptomyces sp. SBT349 TaxID=1580539 RepID=UPI00131DD01E|nr:phage tail tape measure protein [Streptomyces sp. SBT349]
MNGAAGQPAANAGDAAGRNFGGAFKAGLAGVALAAGMALFAGISEAMNQGRIVSMMQASMGTTPEVAERYGQVAGELFANAVTADFQTAADAVAETMNHGLLPTDATMGQIETMSTGLADVATLLGEEVGPTARAVGKILKTGLADDGTEALDLLTRGVQTGANEADDLLDTFSEYATQFRQLGLSGDQAMGLLSQGLKGGARDADLVADTLKEGTLILQEMGEEAATALDEIGLSAEDIQGRIAGGGDGAAEALDDILDGLRDVKDPADQAALAVDLFGTKAEDMQDAILSLDPSQAAEDLGEFEGAAKSAGDTLRDNAATRVEQFKRTLQQNFVEFIGGEVIPRLQELKEEFGPTFQAGVDAARDFWTQAKPWVKEATDGLSGLGDGFRGVETDATTSMSGTQAAVYSGLTQVGAAFSSGETLIRDGWALFGEDLVGIARTYLGQTVEEWKGRLQIVSGFLQMWAGVFSGDWRKIWAGAKDVLTGAKDIIVSRWQAGLGVVRNLTSAGMGLVSSGWSAAWGGMKSGASGAGRWVVNDTKSWLSQMRSRMASGLGGAVGLFRALKSKVQGALSGAPDWLVAAGKAIIRGLITGLRSAMGGLMGALGGIAGKVIGHFPNSPAKEGPLRQYPPQKSGAKIVNFLADGMRSATSDVSAASALAAGAAIPATAAAYRSGPGTAAAPQPVLRVQADGSRASQAVMWLIQNSVRTDYGSSVTAAFTPGR